MIFHQYFLRGRYCLAVVMACASSAIAVGALAQEPPDREAAEKFERRIRPILAEFCVKCHGPARAEAGLRLDSRAAILEGGDSGPRSFPVAPTVA